MEDEKSWGWVAPSQIRLIISAEQVKGSTHKEVYYNLRYREESALRKGLSAKNTVSCVFSVPHTHTRVRACARATKTQLHRARMVSGVARSTR